MRLLAPASEVAQVFLVGSPEVFAVSPEEAPHALGRHSSRSRPATVAASHAVCDASGRSTHSAGVCTIMFPHGKIIERAVFREPVGLEVMPYLLTQIPLLKPYLEYPYHCPCLVLFRRDFLLESGDFKRIKYALGQHIAHKGLVINVYAFLCHEAEIAIISDIQKMNIQGYLKHRLAPPPQGCGHPQENPPVPGQHWHNTKWEFFIVVSGHGLIQERKLGTDEIIEFEVTGDNIQCIHMLPGYTHNIINLSETENLVTVMYCNEIFDPGKPDTYFEKV